MKSNLSDINFDGGSSTINQHFQREAKRMVDEKNGSHESAIKKLLNVDTSLEAIRDLIQSNNTQKEETLARDASLACEFPESFKLSTLERMT